MNYYEWKLACKNKTANHHWDGACRRLQKSLQYNPDPKAIHRHHLRDTEEQRKYNDEHYELWGFEIDEDGNEHFEYGKYIVFITPEEHNIIHSASVETRKKRSRSLTGHAVSDLTRFKISKANKVAYSDPKRKQAISDRCKGKPLSDLHRQHLIENHADLSGEKHPLYGKHHSEEARKKISDAHKGNNYGYVGENHWLYGKKGDQSPRYGKKASEESRKKMRDSHIGYIMPQSQKDAISESNKGKHRSDEQKRNYSIAQKKCVGERSVAFKNYRESGGNLSWNEFQKEIKLGNIDMYMYITN